MDVLALSGSLRAASINTAFCRVVARLAPEGMRVTLYEGLGDLPPFNPDIDSPAPPPVARLRAAVAGAGTLLIASPEYAHGISGVMKNALDWLVSDPAVVHKPVALVNTSPRAHHARDALAEVLRTMSTDLISGASITVPLLGSCVTVEAMLASAEVRAAVQGMLASMAAHISARAVQGPSFPLG